jgi:hypothetical protein
MRRNGCRAGTPSGEDRAVSSHELKNLLDQVPDTFELVLRRPRSRGADLDAWHEAREEARDAYRTWIAHHSAEAYTVYRAAQDREDAAQDTLATTARGRARAVTA